VAFIIVFSEVYQELLCECYHLSYTNLILQLRISA
jgi:hypothetical protein